MSGRFFLDTNIFVYSFDRSAPSKASTSKQLISKALATQKGAVSYQVVQEFFNVALRKFPRPMSNIDAEHYLRTVFRPLLSVHSSATLYGEALGLYGKGGLSWYDAVIVSAAIQSDCDRLMTEDLQHGRKFGSLQIVNPFL